VPRSLTYRKLAFANYPARCVYCGYGIPEVLEVAHLDCNRTNCGLDNLAILCPTCHRMHDLALIPTDIIVRLRDEPPTANWAKLQKDGPRKAAATLERKRRARKAVATRREYAARRSARGESVDTPADATHGDDSPAT
jgi:hypothetical protein